MKQTSKLRILLLLLAAFMLVAVACGGNDDEAGVNGDLDGNVGVEDEAGLGGLPEENTDPDVVVVDPLETEEPVATDEPIATEEATATEEPVATEEATATVEVETPEPTEEVDVTPEVTDTAEVSPTMVLTRELVMSDPSLQLIRSEALNELSVFGTEGTELGAAEEDGIEDILFNENGDIVYILWNDSANERISAIDWTQLTADFDAEIAPQVWSFNFAGAATDLENAVEIDAELLEGDQPWLIPSELNLETDGNYLFRVSDFQGTGDYSLYNSAGEELGEIEDLLINLMEGRVVYGIVEVGGFLGLDETPVVVPWDRFQFSEEQEGFVADFTAEQLEQMPLFDSEQWQTGLPTEPGWNEEVEAFWADFE